MSKEVLSRAQHEGHGGDRAMASYGAAPVSDPGLRSGAEKYGGKLQTASDTNFAENTSVDFANNGLVGK